VGMTVHPHTQSDPPLEEGSAWEIERGLLRRGLRRMEAHRFVCSNCRRSPLVGERLHVFRAADGRERLVCGLCAHEAEHTSLGEPVGVLRMRAGERPLAVRRAA
jgi:hypothetical protein